MTDLNNVALDRLLTRKLGPLASNAVRREYEDGEVIFEEGSASDGLYLVLEGEVSFGKRGQEGKYRTVSYSRQGDFFGEIGILTGHARSLQAIARGRTKIMKIPSENLVAYLEEMPGPINNLLQSVIKHLHETTQHYMAEMLRQEKMAMVGTMMNSIIHDFKNPFCLISLSAQLIEQAHPDERTRKLCQNITSQVQRMLGMATEIAEFSRGQQKLNMTRLNLREVLVHFRTQNEPFFNLEAIKVEIAVPDLLIEGEEAKILRVLQNLVSNAIEAIGERPGRIVIRGEAIDNQAILTISDNGPGIPEEIRGQLWEPFVTKGKSGGTGLGTAISKSIIEAHGGVISFETQTDRGTSFIIRLPLYVKKRM